MSWNGRSGPGMLSRRALLAACALAPVASAAPLSVLLVGDSLAYQLGPRLRPVLQARGRTLVTLGRGGTSARQWVERGWLRAAVQRYPTELLLISLGTNCVTTERPQLGATMRQLAALARSPVLWLSPPPLRYNTAYIRAGAAAAEVTLFEPGKLPMGRERDPRRPGRWREDVHPTHAGYQRWARLLTEYLYDDARD